MKLRKIINTTRLKLRYGLIVEWYNFWYIVFRKKQKKNPQVASIDETIRKIVEEHCSISRFGDGEILLTINKSIGFQEGNTRLAKRLIEIIQSDNEKHLVCISDTFTDLERYNRKATRFWRAHFYLFGDLWDKYLLKDKIYYNTFITRPYMDFKFKNESGHWFTLLKTIWGDRDVIFIEGEKSRMGVGNDLFQNARSIKRIICPAVNAFEKYNDILNKAKEMDKSTLFLIALGPTATVLAFDLYKAGFQAIDVGHVDIEYEWYRMNAKRKVKIPSKYVNEAVGGNIVTDSSDKDYRNQIICSIV